MMWNKTRHSLRPSHHCAGVALIAGVAIPELMLHRRTPLALPLSKPIAHTEAWSTPFSGIPSLYSPGLNLARTAASLASSNLRSATVRSGPRGISAHTAHANA